MQNHLGVLVAWMQESRFKIKRQWDGQGSPARAVEKSGTPYQQHCSDSDWFTNWLTVLCVCIMCACLVLYYVNQDLHEKLQVLQMQYFLLQNNMTNQKPIMFLISAVKRSWLSQSPIAMQQSTVYVQEPCIAMTTSKYLLIWYNSFHLSIIWLTSSKALNWKVFYIVLLLCRPSPILSLNKAGWMHAVDWMYSIAPLHNPLVATFVSLLHQHCIARHCNSKGAQTFASPLAGFVPLGIN